MQEDLQKTCHRKMFTTGSQYELDVSFLILLTDFSDA
jgi:hypothetical protein